MKKKDYLIYGFVLLALFLILLIFVSFGLVNGLDNSVNNFVPGIVSSSLTSLMIFFTNLMENEVVMVFALILIAVLFILKRKKEVLLVVGTFAFAEIVKEGFKILIQRARPLNSLINETGFSFPSGHSTFAILFFLIIIYLFKDSIKDNVLRYSFVIFNLVLILLVGFSRIYLGVHWITDVVGGFLLGGFVFCMGVYIFKNYTTTGLSR